MGRVYPSSPSDDPQGTKRRVPLTGAAGTTTPTPSGFVLPTLPTGAGVTDAARNQVLQTLGEGTDMANKMWAPGSLGRVSTPREAETKALITAQEGRLGGMTDREQGAARENALLSINQQANQRLRAIGNQAAGNGLRGGVVAGEQAQVLGGAQSAYASALQDLMGKVQKSQVDASSELGNTLSSARGLEQGAQATNVNAAAAELAGKLSTPFDYANVLDTAQTNDRTEVNAGTLRDEKAGDAEDKIREAEKNRNETLEEADDDRLKTGSDVVDSAPQNALARAYGFSRYEDMPPGVRDELRILVPSNNGAEATDEDVFRYLNDPANKNMLDKLIKEAKARRRGE